jgi:hypothetical protein
VFVKSFLLARYCLLAALRQFLVRLGVALGGVRVVAGVGSPLVTASLLHDALLATIRSNREGTNIPDAIEQELVQIALREAKGNITQAARLLGIDRNALQRRVEKYGVSNVSDE